MTARPFLTAEWRFLAMLNFEIAPATLAPCVPRGTELDSFDGRTLVSLVAFRFLRTRVLGAPIPFHRNFTEVNLRFYVRRMGAEGWRRGVVFIREFVPRPAIAWVARLCYGEPYRTSAMRHRIEMTDAAAGAPGVVEYQWKSAGRWHTISVETGGAPAVPESRSEAAFIAEHYWGYTAQRDGASREYRVTHQPWRVWPATATLDCDAASLYGSAFASALSAPPCSAFVAEGSPVAVYRSETLAV